MNISLKTSNQFNTTTWSGGTTTELFIHPIHSAYALRNFDFRLSTATVETQKSDFTPLPGISRKLLLLDGEMTLYHDNHSSEQLRKFDVAAFDGGLKTTSEGMCTDFNLMMRGTTKGIVQGKSLEPNKLINYQVPDSLTYLFMYVFKGRMDVCIGKDVFPMPAGDLLIIENPIGSFELLAIKKSELVMVVIGD